MIKNMNRINVLVKAAFIPLIFCIFWNNGNVIKVDAASKKTKTNTSTFSFLSSDGEICSAAVYTTLTQKYTTSGENATYKKRKAYVGMGYIASYTIPNLTVFNPIYVDKNNNSKKTFSWTKNTNTSIVPGDVKVSGFNKYNKTKVVYSKTNGYYYSVTYIVGNSGYVVSPYRSKQVKMALKIS